MVLEYFKIKEKLEHYIEYGVKEYKEKHCAYREFEA